MRLDGRGAPLEGPPPGRVVGLPAARALALGKGYMLALTQDRKLYAWGGQAAAGATSASAICKP